MSIKLAVKEFVEAHKPSRIDVEHITRGFGSVEAYLESESQQNGDCGERYIQIDGFDSKSGNPINICWYEEAWQIGYFSKPLDERTTPSDCEPTIIFDPDFDCAIDYALAKIVEDDVYDLTVTRFDDGAPMEAVDINDYLPEESQ